MYIVLEMQTTGDTTAILPPVGFTDLNVAYQKYYQVLSAAAVSKVPIHTAMIISPKGEVIRTDYFEHEEVVVETEVEE